MKKALKNREIRWENGSTLYLGESNLKYLSKLLLVLTLLLGISGCSDTEGAQRTAKTIKPKTTLKIAAASSLEYAFQEKLIPMYEKAHPTINVEGTYDSSGKLQTQIEAGMEADLFFSAATKQMDALTAEDLVDKTTVENILENKVVLITPQDNPADLESFIDITKATSIAIGDPESVPAGQYAQAILEKLNLWESLADRFSLGTNVTEVLHWVAAGSAEAGLVYETDAKTTDQVTVIDEAPAASLSEPILYPAAVVKTSQHPQATKDFLAFLQSDKAAIVFRDYGFTPLASTK